MNKFVNRRQFLGASAMVTAGLALPKELLASKKKSLLVFTKSSGWEHDVVKQIDGRPSIVDDAVTSSRAETWFRSNNFKRRPDFRLQGFPEVRSRSLFTTGDLTKTGTDKNPPMSPQGKQALLDAIHGGLGFVGVHAGADTFHTEPDPQDLSNRYVAHGEQSDPYLRMLGGEFILHGSIRGCRPPT